MNCNLRLLKIFPVIVLLISCNKDATEHKADRTDGIIHIESNAAYLDSLESVLFRRYHRSPESLIAQYGQPLNIQYDTLWNLYYQCADSIVTLYFPGSIVMLHHVVGDGRYLFNGVVVRDSVTLADVGLVKGMPIDSLEAALKKSHRTLRGNSPNEIILDYSVHEKGAESFLQFKFVDNRFAELAYEPWMD